MRGGETTKRLGIVLMAAMIILCMIPGGQANAYSGGLLDGKAMQRNTGPTTALTDNDLNSGIYMYDGYVPGGVSYTFTEPMRISHYYLYMNPASVARLVFYKEDGSIARTISGYDLANNAKTALSVTGVAKVTIFGDPNNGYNLYEMDVWGYSEENGPPDNDPPATPSGLTGTPGDKQVTLRWNANSEPDLASYRVYKDGVLWGTVSTSTAVITGLTNDQAYGFRVASVDKSGNESSRTNAITVTPKGPPPPDTEPPKVPTLSGKPGKSQAVLSWTKSTDSDLSGYNVYQDGEKVGNYTSNAATISNLKNGTEYKFRVTAFDVSGNESAKSNEVSITPIEKLDVNLIPNGDSIVVQILTGGTGPYVINWELAQKTVDQSQYVIANLQFDTEYTVTITDSNGLTYTAKVNTGTEKGFIPPSLPNPQEMFQKMLSVFATAGQIAISVIGAAVALGVMVLLAYWGWLLLKRWLARAK